MDDVTAADQLLAACWTPAGDAAPSREDWRSVGPERARSDELRRFMLTAADALGARHLEVTPDTSRAPWDAGHRASEFALLAAQAAAAGTRLGIEFLPWSNIRTVHDALRLVEDAAHLAMDLVVIP